jgi:hypothetical protein
MLVCLRIFSAVKVMKAPIWPFSHWTKVPTLRLNRGGCLIHSEQCPVLAQSRPSENSGAAKCQMTPVAIGPSADCQRLLGAKQTHAGFLSYSLPL